MRLTLKTFLIWALAYAAAMTPFRATRAVVVLKKGDKPPIMGHLVRADERVVVVREELAGGKTREVVVPRGEIDELLETVSSERLAALDPARPAAYFEYGEELAEKRRDPEARDAARRLLTIAAHRGDARMRHSSLLILADLAPNEDERRRIEALIYLLNPRHELSGPGSVARGSPANAAARGELVAAIRFIRQGQGQAAAAILQKEPVQEAIARIGNVVTAEELEGLTGARSLTEKQLASLLRAELALLGDGGGGQSARSWSQSAVGGELAPMRPISLAAISELDPGQCLFRAGKWVEP